MSIIKNHSLRWGRIISVTVKKISVGMELENVKTESVNENENQENKSVDEFQE